MTIHEWTKCARCMQLGYFSPKFGEVLCNWHFFEANGRLKAEGDTSQLSINWSDKEKAPAPCP